jgi:GGDEF domain-containing protein
MSLSGPIVVVAEKRSEGLVAAIAEAGAFPVVETPWADVISAIETIKPSAVVLADTAPDTPEVAVSLARLAERAGPALPVIGRADEDGAPAFAGALTIPPDAPVERMIARIAGALRLRTLEGTVLRRAETLMTERRIVADMPDTDPVEDSTVLVIGRGRSHPALGTAFGERCGVMGALSIDAAARCLQARDIEGIAIGEGLGPRHVDAFLSALAADSRFRDLPVGLLGDWPAPAALLNLTRAREPGPLVERMIPLVRLRAYEGRLKRLMASIEKMGMLDPMTGLLNADAFDRDLARAVEDAPDRGSALTLARFSFQGLADRRAMLDAARLMVRLMRSADFGCRQDDGSIVTAFTGTDLRSAHVVARRLAAILRQTMLPAGPGREPATPHITLATLKPSDSAGSLMARLTPPAVAPERASA